ncbi:hypothetical protein [Sphingomonas sp. TDK1]|uniref:hypothetical protein n=1 Tax=Sphingomonas sp. TDK1 TaxID=453247 RepID=UPI0007DA0E8D|nr:hypothetical protein [Sphingomonas sp. TDK1]OAN67116.1 hypothetical protein A7X12_00340 [Sphingomonas sp. TDK1]
MAETEKTKEDEITKLRAQVRHLEAELERTRKQEDGDEEDDRGRRFFDSISDTRHTKADTATRMVRGMTLAGVEAVRVFADSVSSFGDDVLRRSEARGGRHRTVRQLVNRLPDDIVTSLADAADRFSEIPSKAADRYSKSYKEGEKSEHSTR